MNGFVGSRDELGDAGLQEQRGLEITVSQVEVGGGEKLEPGLEGGRGEGGRGGAGARGELPGAVLQVQEVGGNQRGTCVS